MLLPPAVFKALVAGTRRARRRRLAMMIISYNSSCKGRPKRQPHGIQGDRTDEEDVFGVAAGRQCDAVLRAAKNSRDEDFALGAGRASAAEGDGGLGRRGREGLRRYHPLQGLPG